MWLNISIHSTLLVHSGMVVIHIPHIIPLYSAGVVLMFSFIGYILIGKLYTNKPMIHVGNDKNRQVLIF